MSRGSDGTKPEKTIKNQKQWRPSLNPHSSQWLYGWRIRDSVVAHLACSYRNTSDRMVILRCIGPEQFFLERVVFPFELLSFQCPPSSVVKIWTHGLGGPELVETVNAGDLLNEAASQPAQSAQPAQLEALPSSRSYVPGLLDGELPWATAS